ncbi:hypothetical protein O9G_000317 [Rozella allomycis CSF55]|uniref:BRCT domain-containing protein n=1 Tax=Rozella allomycis (strain CSF55) TaxID=988480 RepID=A0A075APB0_ROZAC|nr:hypothetical protein O9G_000317 [Rozella allomycis CSF55]|eukprot:EPZ31838.1 hypothetical protein O9G_000317 [Rozella allomycis CSF55]
MENDDDQVISQLYSAASVLSSDNKFEFDFAVNSNFVRDVTTEEEEFTVEVFSHPIEEELEGNVGDGKHVGDGFDRDNGVGRDVEGAEEVVRVDDNEEDNEIDMTKEDGNGEENAENIATEIDNVATVDETTADKEDEKINENNESEEEDFGFKYFEMNEIEATHENLMHDQFEEYNKFLIDSEIGLVENVEPKDESESKDVEDEDEFLAATQLPDDFETANVEIPVVESFEVEGTEREQLTEGVDEVTEEDDKREEGNEQAEIEPIENAKDNAVMEDFEILGEFEGEKQVETIEESVDRDSSEVEYVESEHNKVEHNVEHEEVEHGRIEHDVVENDEVCGERVDENEENNNLNENEMVADQVDVSMEKREETNYETRTEDGMDGMDIVEDFERDVMFAESQIIGRSEEVMVEEDEESKEENESIEENNQQIESLNMESEVNKKIDTIEESHHHDNTETFTGGILNVDNKMEAVTGEHPIDKVEVTHKVDTEMHHNVDVEAVVLHSSENVEMSETHQFETELDSLDESLDLRGVEKEKEIEKLKFHFKSLIETFKVNFEASNQAKKYFEKENETIENNFNLIKERKMEISILENLRNMNEKNLIQEKEKKKILDLFEFSFNNFNYHLLYEMLFKWDNSIKETIDFIYSDFLDKLEKVFLKLRRENKIFLELFKRLENKIFELEKFSSSRVEKKEKNFINEIIKEIKDKEIEMEKISNQSKDFKVQVLNKFDLFKNDLIIMKKQVGMFREIWIESLREVLENYKNDSKENKINKEKIIELESILKCLTNHSNHLELELNKEKSERNEIENNLKTKYESEIENYKKRFESEMQNEIQSLQNEIQSLQNENESLKEKIQSENLNEIQNEIDSLKNNIELLANEKETLINQNMELKETVQVTKLELKNNNESLNNENTLLKETIEALKSENEMLKKENITLNENVEALKNENIGLNNSVEELKNETNKSNETVEYLKSEKSKLNETVESLQSNIELLNNENESLNEKYQNILTENNSTKENVNNLLIEIESLKENSQSNDKIIQLENDLKRSIDEKNNLENILNNLKSENSNKLNELELSHSTKISSLNQELISKISEIDSLKSEIEKLKNLNSSLEKDLKSAKDSLKDFEIENIKNDDFDFDTSISVLTPSIQHKRKLVNDSGILKPIENSSMSAKKIRKDASRVAHPVIMLSGFQEKHPIYNLELRERLIEILNRLNIEFLLTSNFEDKITHLVAWSDNKTLKYYASCITFKWVMHHEWLLESGRRGYLIDEESFGKQLSTNPVLKKKIYRTSKYLKEMERKTVRKDYGDILLIQLGNGVYTDDRQEADIVLKADKEAFTSSIPSFTWSQLLNLIERGQ